jgi:hypothetical protein
LPGEKTIPDQIVENKRPYYSALEMADSQLKEGATDVSAIEELIKACLATQLLGVHDDASAVVRHAHRAVDIPPRHRQSDLRPSMRAGMIDWIEKHPATVAAVVAILLAILGFVVTR